MIAPVTLLKNTNGSKSVAPCTTCRFDKLISDSQYAHARRQGLYMAACIIDEVDKLKGKTPENIIDEIRLRLSELVRREL